MNLFLNFYIAKVNKACQKINNLLEKIFLILVDKETISLISKALLPVKKKTNFLL